MLVLSAASSVCHERCSDFCDDEGYAFLGAGVGDCLPRMYYDDDVFYEYLDQWDCCCVFDLYPVGMINRGHEHNECCFVLCRSILGGMCVTSHGSRSSDCDCTRYRSER